MYLQGPEMVFTFADEHHQAKKHFENDIKDVAKDLLKLQPYSVYEADDGGKTKDLEIGIKDGEQYGDIAHEDIESPTVWAAQKQPEQEKGSPSPEPQQAKKEEEEK